MENNIEKKLSGLPRAKLSKKADRKIRFRLYLLMLKNKLFNFPALNKAGFWLKPATSLALLILFLFLGSGAYAYSSDKVTRGHFFYPFKRGLERVELDFSLSQLAKVRTYSKFAQRRVAEAKVLSLGGRLSIGFISSARAQAEATGVDSGEMFSYLSKTINESVVNIEQAKDEAVKITAGQKLARALEIISQTEERQLETLEDIAGIVGIDTGDQDLDSIAVALDTVRKQHRDIIKKAELAAKAARKQDKINLAELADDDASSSVQSEIEDEVVASSSVKFSDPAEAESSLIQLKNKIENFKGSLKDNNLDEEEFNKLFDRLDKKIETAQETIDQGNLNKLSGILRATEALTNNGRHFLRLKERRSGDRFDERNRLVPVSTSTQSDGEAEERLREEARKQFKQAEEEREQKRQEELENLKQTQEQELERAKQAAEEQKQVEDNRDNQAEDN